jgi:hypothetical protein
MIHFLKLCYNVFILGKQDWHTSVQKNLCQNVLYHVGNCVSLCQYGEGFLLVIHEVSMWTTNGILTPYDSISIALGVTTKSLAKATFVVTESKFEITEGN